MRLNIGDTVYSVPQEEQGEVTDMSVVESSGSGHLVTRVTIEFDSEIAEMTADGVFGAFERGEFE